MSGLKKLFKSGSNDEEVSSPTNTSSGYNTSSPTQQSTGDRVSIGGTGDRSYASNEGRTGSGLTGDRVVSGSNTGSGLPSGAGSGLTGAGSGMTGNHERDTTTSSTGGLSGQVEKLGLFGTTHRHGHENTLASKFDPSAESTTHDHKHLNHVTHREIHHHEVEEVERQREHHRHIHHVQHHVQPVHDVVNNDEVHHQKSHPITKISEQHVNTDEDRQLFAGLGEKHRDQEIHHPKQRTIVDLGERVTEVVHHHVHHITQPVVRQEVHERHRIHTIIPTHHTTHESPIVHKSSLHEPVAMADFLKGGGKLGSGISHNQAGVLQTGECNRTVDGVSERLAQELHLGSSSSTSGLTSGRETSPRESSGPVSSANRDSTLSSGSTGVNHRDAGVFSSPTSA